MTVIASFKNSVSAAVMGDVLITSPSLHPLKAIVTSHLRENVETGSNFIKRLTSKVCILRDNLAIAWTGSEIICQVFIKFLDDKLSANPHFAELEQICLKYDHRSNASIVGAIASQSKIFSFIFDLNDLTIKRRRQFIDGSGANHLQQIIDNDPYPETKQEAKINKEKLGIGKIGLWVLHQISELSFLEAAGWPTLENKFGCGYDIAIMIEKNFYRIQSIQTVFYYVQLKSSDNHDQIVNIAPSEVMFMQTYNQNGTMKLEKLMLNHIEAYNHGKSAFLSIVSSEARIVKPIIQEKKYRSIEPAGNFTRVCFMFSLKSGEVYRKATIVRHPTRIFNAQIYRDNIGGSFAYVFKGSDDLFHVALDAVQHPSFPRDDWKPFEKKLAKGAYV